MKRSKVINLVLVILMTISITTNFTAIHIAYAVNGRSISNTEEIQNLFADFNGDGETTMSDAVILARFNVEDRTVKYVNMHDLNNDGLVNANDLAILLIYLDELEKDNPPETTTTTTDTTTTETTTTTTTTKNVPNNHENEYWEVLDSKGGTMREDFYPLLIQMVQQMGWEDYEYSYSEAPIDGAVVVADMAFCRIPAAFVYVERAGNFIELAQKQGWTLYEEDYDPDWLEYMNEYSDWSLCWRFSDNEDPTEDTYVKEFDFMWCCGEIVFDWAIPIDHSNGNFKWPGFYAIEKK